MDSDMVSGGHQDGSGFSRRTLIKAGAVVGGTVWVAPVIESFTNKAAAVSLGPGHFPCSYATVIYTIGTGTTLYAVKFNDPNAGCNVNNTDGMYGGDTLGTCGSVTYAVDSNNVLTADSGSGANEISDTPGVSNPCAFFSGVSTCTVTATGATIQAVLLHDGSIKNGNLPAVDGGNGTLLCGPSTSFTVPSGDCGC